MKVDYPIHWQRFWCPRNGSIRFGNDGFLIDPSTEWGRHYNPDLSPVDLHSELPCIVLLGEPGSGKSTTLQAERTNTQARLSESGAESHWLDLHEIGSDTQLWRRLSDSSRISAWKQGTSDLYLFLDSFDECRVQINTLHALLLNELHDFPIERLRLRIACRTADWPLALEQGLSKLFGADSVQVFELAPLRRLDIELAAEEFNVDSSAFLSTVSRVGAAPLALKPLTLMFLLRMYARDGDLPHRQAELYYEGCRLLCEESKGRRELRLPRALEAEQRLAVAKRAAALTVFPNRAAIAINADQTDLFDSDLGKDELIGGVERAIGTAFAVNTPGIDEALNTGLFSARGEGRLGWAHRTYEEFLAARYLVDHGVPLAQILSLVVNSGDPSGKLIPQLRETASWLASMRPDVFREILARDVEVLIRSDVASASAEDRRDFVAALLRACDSGEWIDRDWGIRRHLAKLNHADLDAQLRPLITDRAKGVVVRRVAIHIAEECKVRNLVDDLVALALDPNAPLETRVPAGYAVVDIGDSANKQRLRSLIFATATEDPDEELKGVGLKAAWPAHLTTEELLAALTRPRRSNLLGAYRTFLYSDPIDQIPKEDLPLVLEWAAKHERTQFADDIDRLVQSSIRRAFDHLDIPGVLDGLARVLIANLRLRDRLFSSEEGSPLTDAGRRRQVLRSMVSLISDGNDVYRLLWTGLILPEDAVWMVEQFESCPESEKERWAILLSRTLRHDDLVALDAAWEACQSNVRLRDALFAFFGAVSLDSEEARRQQEHYQMLSESNGFNSTAEEPSDTFIHSLIAEQLKEFASGDLSGWWRLNLTLTLVPGNAYYGNEFDSDLTNLPGWKGSSEEVRASLVQASERYIREYTPEPERWIDSGPQWINYRPDWAGFRAFRLLQANKPPSLEKLSQEVWQKWAPIIVAYPEFDQGGQTGWHQRLVAQAYLNAPDETLATVRRRLRVECGEQSPSIDRLLRVLSLAWDGRIEACLLEEAQAPAIPSTVLNELLDVLLEQGSEAALQLTLSLTPARLPRRKSDYERLAMLAELLFTWTPSTSWSIIYSKFKTSRKFTEKVFRRIVWAEHRQNSIMARMNEDQLFELYVLLTRFYPPDEDPKLDGFGTVTFRMEIGRWRDRLLTELKLRGTEESCQAVERLASLLPAQSWLKWVALESREIYRQRTWNPLKPAEIIKLVQSPDLRIVQSADQLLKVVIESLKRLEHKLQVAVPPAAIDLWNEVSANCFRPKEEERLSDYIKRHLDADLRDRGIIFNREVTNRKGEENDIRVEALLRSEDGEPKDFLAVLVEVKGCWNKELHTAMADQLVGRYLRKSDTMHGLYVVGRYNSDKWDKDDWMYRQAPKTSRCALQQRLDKQAERLSTTGMNVRALVLDTSLSH